MQNNKRSNQKTRRKQKAAQSAWVVTPLKPPEYLSNTLVSKTFRFQVSFNSSSSPTTYNITPAKLGALQVICTATNATGTQLYEAAKIRRIKIWASPPPTGMVNVGLTFGGTALGVAGPNRTYSDQSIGMTRPAFVDGVPGKLTQAGQWQSCATNVGTNTIFTMLFTAVGTGAGTLIPITIDVDLTLRMTNDARATNNTCTLASAILTQMYYLALDNSAGATGSVNSDIAPDRNLIFAA